MTAPEPHRVPVHPPQALASPAARWMLDRYVEDHPDHPIPDPRQIPLALEEPRHDAR